MIPEAISPNSQSYDPLALAGCESRHMAASHNTLVSVCKGIGGWQSITSTRGMKCELYIHTPSLVHPLVCCASLRNWWITSYCWTPSARSSYMVQATKTVWFGHTYSKELHHGSQYGIKHYGSGLKGKWNMRRLWLRYGWFQVMLSFHIYDILVLDAAVTLKFSFYLIISSCITHRIFM